MMRPATVLAVAVAEMRSARRLARTWIFAVLSLLVASIAFGYFSIIHGMASGYSATAGFVGARFLISAMGFYLLWIMLLGMIFLAFDLRSRDTRERVAEVLDARPLSNLELLVGRLLGLVVVGWAPMLVLAVLVQSFGLIAVATDLWFGEPLEPGSLIAYVLAEALPSLILWCAIVMLLTVLLRNRLVTALVALVLIATPIVALTLVPAYMSPIVSFVATPSQFPSDILATTATSLTPQTISHRLAMLLLGAGFVLWAAALYPRRDDASRAVQLGAGSVLVVAALGIGVALAVQAGAGLRDREAWLAAHEVHRNTAHADLVALAGTVQVDPGSNLAIDVELTFTAPPGSPSELVFSLNPGLEVTEALLDGQPVEHRHELGLLLVEPSRPLAAASEHVLSVVASGTPNSWFGYLDAVVEPWKQTGQDNQIQVLGTESMVFEDEYAALLPGARWLPHPGGNVTPAVYGTHRRDTFDLDLTVEVPDGWLVAGPGLREELAEGRFRFRPPAPVPEFALAVGRFERRAVEVAGVTFELLLDEAHTRNLAVFDEAADAVAGRLTEIFDEAASLGLPYPYRGLSLVEVPTTLRSYGGGWRMDTALAQPGLMLMRETSWPTARFEFWFEIVSSREGMEAEHEGGVPEAKVRGLERFFENDIGGGNIFLGVARNFLGFQTAAAGPGAPALDFVAETLLMRLLSDRDGHFSAHIFASGDSFGGVMAQTMTTLFGGEGEDSIVDSVATAASDQPSVWDRALGAPLGELDVWEDPAKAFNVITLKGRAIATVLLDDLGREGAAAMLAELRRRHAGGTFTAEDFHAAAAASGADITSLLGDWLDDEAMPGFIASNVSVVRLRDDELGKPRYQIRLIVQNGEPAPGLARVRFSTRQSAEEEANWIAGDPLRIPGNSAVEVGLIAGGAPQAVELEHYLSLNRDAVALKLPEVDQENTADDEPFVGARPVEGPLPVGDPREIIVDDLDPGFAVASTEAEGDGVRVGGGLQFSMDFGPEADVDQGLPTYQSFTAAPTGFSRQTASSAWGRYRHTIARATTGQGNHAATFAAELPESGRWRLAYHLPAMSGASGVVSARAARGAVVVSASTGGSGAYFGRQGTYDIALESAGESQEVEFDASVAESGWNDLGEFDLPAGEVRVKVTNSTSGRTVVADAIRWSPANG
ncbi:MAG: hypothetical protein F4Y86_01135 [Gammaproteobacteria bacterium]|nr:hypothetical protein [Gammaproteobacteria bacterium]